VFDLDAAARQAHSLDHVEHRPWPVPERGWSLGHSLVDVLFTHWRVPVEAVREHVPSQLEVDEHDGSAWVGIAAFKVAALRARGLLPLPGVSTYLEVNVRTCVTTEEKPGIWFLSVDVSNRLAAEVARRRYRLPYHHARMSAGRRDDWLEYECARNDEPGRVFSARFEAPGAASAGGPSSLERFLTERYCLYTGGDGEPLQRVEIHRAPWDLRPAAVELGLTSIAPFDHGDDPVCHCSPGSDIVAWSPQPVA
jgi:hypothetical protein